MPAISLTSGSLSHHSQIGLVMLIGAMAGNGLLIVAFVNQPRAAGRDIDSAIRDAMRLRTGPVMMTMVSTVFGGPPLILTSGAGAAARIAVGWEIVGGLGLATTFTLFLVPVFCRLIVGWGSEPGATSERLVRERRSRCPVGPCRERRHRERERAVMPEAGAVDRHRRRRRFRGRAVPVPSRRAAISCRGRDE